VYLQVIREREIFACLRYILKESDRGNAVNLADCFSMFNLNSTTQMTMSIRACNWTSGSKSDTPVYSTILDRHLISELFTLVSSFNMADFVPILKPFDLQGLKRRMEVVHQRFEKFLNGIIEERKKRLATATTEDFDSDFLDTLLGVGKTSDFKEKLSDDSVKAIIMVSRNDPAFLSLVSSTELKMTFSGIA
jgi:hypothetical protein